MSPEIDYVLEDGSELTASVRDGDVRFLDREAVELGDAERPRFEPFETAFLLDEWVLHEKYLVVLDELGEKNLRRAREAILADGLSSLPSLQVAAAKFMTLKLGATDLEQVRARMPVKTDPDTAGLVDLLRRPFGAFFDYSDPRSLSRLQRLCATARRAVPGAGES